MAECFPLHSFAVDDGLLLRAREQVYTPVMWALFLMPVSAGRPWPADGQSTCLHRVPGGQVPTCWHQLSILGNGDVGTAGLNQIYL